ncbi:UNVERIFIED_CONTAM: hypothetical protein K2H54_069364 [Gekko kuhli]
MAGPASGKDTPPPRKNSTKRDHLECSGWEEIVYEQEGVFIHSSSGNDDQDSLLSGILRLIEKETEVIVDWRPVDESLDSSNILYARKDSSSVVEWAHTPKEKTPRGPEHMNSYEAEWDMVNTVSFKKKPHSNGGT